MDSYNERDIKAILNRALELQQHYTDIPGIPAHREELTFEDIKEIARELGVSTDFVKEAALEYEGIPVEEPLFLDTGNNYEVELIGFARGELDEKTWTELRTVIEHHFNCSGKVKRRPHSIIWKAEPTGISKYTHIRKSPVVEVSTSNNRSTVRIKQSLKTFNKLLYPAYTALLGSAMMVGGLVGSGGDAGAFLTVAALLAGTAKLFHSLTQNRKQKVREQLKDFTEQLQTIVTRQFKALSNSEQSVENEMISIEDKTISETESYRSPKKNKTR